MHDILQTFIEMRKHANSHVTFFCFGAVGHEICEVPVVTSNVHRPNKASLVFPTNIWKISKVFGMFPNVFGFLGFVKSANTKNANPKIRSFISMLQPLGPSTTPLIDGSLYVTLELKLGLS